MIIVLEYQFWDLDILDLGFEVMLKFFGVFKYFKVFFLVVLCFYDLSVGFYFQFEYEFEDGDVVYLVVQLVVFDNEQVSLEVIGMDDDGVQVVSFDSFCKK